MRPFEGRFRWTTDPCARLCESGGCLKYRVAARGEAAHIAGRHSEQLLGICCCALVRQEGRDNDRRVDDGDERHLAAVLVTFFAELSYQPCSVDRARLAPLKPARLEEPARRVAPHERVRDVIFGHRKPGLGFAGFERAGGDERPDSGEWDREAEGGLFGRDEYDSFHSLSISRWPTGKTALAGVVPARSPH